MDLLVASSVELALLQDEELALPLNFAARRLLFDLMDLYMIAAPPK